jgi:hypothetical protein
MKTVKKRFSYKSFGVVSALAMLFQLSFAYTSEANLRSAQIKQIELVLNSAINSGLPTFETRSPSVQALIRFGVQYNLRNGSKLSSIPGDRSDRRKLAAPQVSTAVMRCFGKKIQHQTVGEWKYLNGNYYVAISEAEGDLECKVIEVKETRTGTHSVNFYVYDTFADTRLLGQRTATLRTSGEYFILASYGIAKVKAKSKPKAKQNSFLISPGVGVGPIRLGMTRSHVRGILGAPQHVYHGHQDSGGLSRENYTNYHLAFSSERANGRVKIIEVESSKFRTKERLSTGSQFKDIVKGHPGMTIIRDDPFEVWEFSYSDRPKGIGFCFRCPRDFGNSVRDRSTHPLSSQHPTTIGVYEKGSRWKKFTSSE